MERIYRVGGEHMNIWNSEWFSWIKALVVAVGLVIIIRIFLFSPIIVDGPSMLPTLHDRDQMIVNKFTYRFGEPDRFDIVIFHATEKKNFIKRVIGLPGEHVMIEDNQLYVNGEAVEQSFMNYGSGDQSPIIINDDFKLENIPGGYDVIPEGYYLVLGDNRNNSTDSRTIGLISKDKIVGKASIIYWPMSRIQIVKE